VISPVANAASHLVVVVVVVFVVVFVVVIYVVTVVTRPSLRGVAHCSVHFVLVLVGG
jgi:hypothetical protein